MRNRDSMYQFDCDLCAEAFEASSMSEMKEHGRAHLNNHHYSELRDVFREKYRGKRCDGGCGYEFPVEMEDAAGFECPSCGYDHFPKFAGQYLWWRLTVE